MIVIFPLKLQNDSLSNPPKAIDYQSPISLLDKILICLNPPTHPEQASSLSS